MLELTVVRLISAELTQSGVFLHYRSAFNIPLSAHWRPCKCGPNGGSAHEDLHDMHVSAHCCVLPVEGLTTGALALDLKGK